MLLIYYNIYNKNSIELIVLLKAKKTTKRKKDLRNIHFEHLKLTVEEIKGRVTLHDVTRQCVILQSGDKWVIFIYKIRQKTYNHSCKCNI